MKANIKLNDYLNYIQSNEFDLNQFQEQYMKDFYGKWNEKDVQIISKAVDNILNKYHNKVESIDVSRYNNAKTVDAYVKLNNFVWNVDMHIDKYVVVSYGKVSIFILEDFVEFIPETDYSKYSISEVKRLLLNNDNVITETKLPAEIKDLSIDDVQSEQKKVTTLMDELQSQMKDVKNAKTNELAKIQKEIDEKVALLNAKKEAMMTELYAKMAEFNEKLRVLKQQIFMLKTNIYSIRCFAGETVELIQLREGKKESKEIPIVLNQKMLYLNEDLAKTMSIYTNDIEGNYKLLEEVLKYSDSVMEMFCPQTKCISFFRCSKTNKNYFYNRDDDILESYDMLHGNKIGFVVRNGENLYVGWLEEEWDTDRSDMDNHSLSFIEDVMYKPQIKTVDENDNTGNTPISEMVSRYFALSVVQGLIEHSEILSVPEKVDIRYTSKYIIHNYADAWLDDNRYGNFADFVENINEYNHVGDTILVIQSIRENNVRTYSANRARGELNTTRDCKVSSGLYKINLIENDRIFIAVKKDDWWIERKNKANFEVETYEFINLEYMNSIWMKYFIDTKKIGQFGSSRDSNTGYNSSLDYSYLIKYFKIAYKFLIDREFEEEQMIKQYVDDISKYNWKELISYWKIINNVRNFTDRRAKQFAKYLMSGEYVKLSNLFGKNYKYVRPSAPLIDLYFATYIKGVYGPDEHRTFGNYKDKISHPELTYDEIDKSFYKEPFDADVSIEEIKEREDLDIKKLGYIVDELKTFAKENNVWNDGKFNISDKDFKDNWILTFSKTAHFIINNFETAHTKYNEIKETFIDEMNKSVFRYYHSDVCDSKLYKLLYLLYIQMYVYPVIEQNICKTIKYNYIYKIEKYD